MCILGKAPDEAIRNIARKMQVSKSQAGKLVMTESAYFASAAQKDCFKELDVEEYEIVATLDHKTSEICQDMDGKVFKMSEFEPGVTAPPFHVWCRSTTVPYFNDEFTLTDKRAARDAEGNTIEVDANMKYADWKKAFVDGGNVQNAFQNTDVVNAPLAYDGDFNDFEPLNLNDQTKDTLNKLNDLGKETEWEHGAVLYPDNTISEILTSRLHDRVAFNVLDTPKGSVLLHCHTNGSPLSSGDLKLLIK